MLDCSEAEKKYNFKLEESILKARLNEEKFLHDYEVYFPASNILDKL